MLDKAARPAVRQKCSKLAPTSCQASSTVAMGTTAVNVVGFFMALLSFRGFDTPSLPAQGEQRLPLIFNIQRGNAPSTEPYYHEALDYRPPSSYAVCSADKGGWVQSLFTTCQAVQLSSFRLVCANGIIGAPALTAAGTSTIAKNAQIDGDVVRIPFYNRWRTADVPDGFHPLPQGWGLAPAALTVTSAATFDPIITHTRIPLVGNRAQTMPENFYVTLASWAPYPALPR